MAKLYLWLAISAALQLTAKAGPTADNFNSKAVCTTAQCVLTASEILRDMQPTADPCVDFSEFACGGFRERYDIPAEEFSVSHFQILAKENSRIIKELATRGGLKSAKAPASDAAAQRNIAKMQDTFESCMNEKQLVTIGRQPLVDEIQKVLNIFPVSDSTSNATLAEGDRRNLSLAMAHFIKSGMKGPLGLSAGPGLETPEKNILGVQEGGLGLPSKELYLEDTLLVVYEKIIGQMLTLILGKEPEEPGMPPQVTEEWAAMAKDIAAFEKELAVASTSFADLMNMSKVNNPVTVAELTAMSTMVDWPLVLQESLPPNVKVPEPLLVSSPPYHAKLDELLKKTTPKTMQNYYTWNVIRQRAASLGAAYQQPMQVLNALLSGANPGAVKERWRECVSVVNKNVGEIAGHYFLQETFNDESRSSVENMISSARDIYTKSFPQYSWLDKITLKGALEKIKAIVQKVGASTDSPDVSSTASLDEYYKDLKVDKDAFFANQVQAAQWTAAKGLEQLNEPVNKKKMMDTVPQTVNAFYNPSLNEIIFPAGILRPPFFHIDNPDYINYGGIGFIIAHELTHGFDNVGQKFDFEGRFVNWWTNVTTTSFNEKAQCFVDQYSNYTIKGVDGKDHPVNGNLTLGENMADAGGLKKGFETWQALSKKAGGRKARRPNNQPLPGLEKMTPEQLYFVSFARLWCNKARPEAELQQLLTDTHSPAQWRINGAVQNTPYFAKAFNCPANSPMNPSKRCEIW